MAELHVDQAEASIIIMGLSALQDAWLDEEGKAARIRLARKLGSVAGELLAAAKAGDSDG